MRYSVPGQSRTAPPVLRLDVLDDAVAVAFASAQREQDVKGGRYEGQERLHLIL